eukprot:279626-Chlamydomonas_euryale.AAC.1
MLRRHTWRAVCNKHVIRMDNKLTPQRIEMAFLVASAVGRYGVDVSLGLTVSSVLFRRSSASVIQRPCF